LKQDIKDDTKDVVDIKDKNIKENITEVIIKDDDDKIDNQDDDEIINNEDIKDNMIIENKKSKNCLIDLVNKKVCYF
jgi:hypothetical protein